MNSDPETKTKKKRGTASKTGTQRAEKYTRFTKLAPKTIEERQNVLLAFLVQADIDRTEQAVEEDRDAPSNFMKSISVKSPPRDESDKKTFLPSIVTKTHPQ